MDIQLHVEKTTKPVRQQGFWRAWLPSRGNILFVLVVAAALLLYVRTAGAVPGAAPAAASNSIIPYQGRLADSGGNPLSGSYAMTFKLYSVANNGSALWTETWSGGNSITVTNGLFNVLLGSLTPISPTTFTTNSSLWLGIKVGVDSEMTPRVQLGSAPWAILASSVEQSNVIANIQAAYDSYAEHHVDASGHTDVISVTVSAAQPATLRITYHALVYKTGSPGRTMIGIRIDGAANTFPDDNSSQLQVGSPVSAGWTYDSENLSGTFYADVLPGPHTVTLVLGSYEAGTSYARVYALNVEVLKQP